METLCQVCLEDGARVPAVTYVMVRPLVEDRRPSHLYHAVIMEGARSAPRTPTTILHLDLCRYETKFNKCLTQILEKAATRAHLNNCKISRNFVDSSNVYWCREHGLPGHYLDTLQRIEHNGEQRGDGSISMTLGRF